MSALPPEVRAARARAKAVLLIDAERHVIAFRDRRSAYDLFVKAASAAQSMCAWHVRAGDYLIAQDYADAAELLDARADRAIFWRRSR